MITTAWGMKNGDVESRNLVTTTTPTSFVEDKKTDAFQDDDGIQYPKSSFADTVCNADLASANTYVAVTALHMPHLIHGVTRLRLSSQSFNEVKQNGKTTLRYLDITTFGNDIKPNYEEGVLARVEPDDVPYPMIVNDQRVNLPAIHLAGTMDIHGKDPRPKKDRPLHTAVDFYVIDDPLNPLVLLIEVEGSNPSRWKVQSRGRERSTSKLRTRSTWLKSSSPKRKRAITYGIYFDFDKDTIKPESEPVLKQIVQAMTDNPDWKLTVNGHTDNIGGDAYNLDLSKRRAAAVKQALVTRYHIAPDRLSTNGYGASSPIDTNDTLEGRARNRRVELTPPVRRSPFGSLHTTKEVDRTMRILIGVLLLLSPPAPSAKPYPSKKASGNVVINKDDGTADVRTHECLTQKSFAEMITKVNAHPGCKLTSQNFSSRGITVDMSCNTSKYQLNTHGVIDVLDSEHVRVTQTSENGLAGSFE